MIEQTYDRCEVEWERPQTESFNSRRGLTRNQVQVDWRATVNGTRICRFDNCGKARLARGYCAGHLSQLSKGNALAPLRYRSPKGTPLEERLLMSVDRRGECWVWTAAAARDGYGRIKANGKMLIAHRVSYETRFGAIPPGLVIDHKCHNRLCINPEHLQAVTERENQQNRAGVPTNSATGVRGVSWDIRRDKYRVRVGDRGGTRWGGYFSSLHDATLAAVALRNVFHINNLKDREAGA